MARAKSLAETAERQAMDAIKEGAIAVLRTGPLVSEYVQAMGSWSFTMTIPYKDSDHFFEAHIGMEDDELERLAERVADGEIVDEYVPHIEPFIEALREFRKLHDDYEGCFGNTAAGTPMRFDGSGKVTTSW